MNIYMIIGLCVVIVLLEIKEQLMNKETQLTYEILNKKIDMIIKQINNK